MNTTNLKPFDLQAALAGAPVVTRNGTKVTAVHHVKTLTRKYDTVLFTVEDTDGQESDWCNEDGSYYFDRSCADMDLFMAPTKKTGWIAVSGTPARDPSGYVALCSHVYATKENAEKHCGKKCVVQVEWEE